MLREPKRERGRIRVAALLDAGATVFAEKGFAAATMTEIAARADAAIGSLYQFFPSKEALADALLARYAERFEGALADIAARGAAVSSAALADALVQLMLDLQSERAVALVLADALTGRSETRVRFRHAIRDHLASILRTADTTLSAARSRSRAAVLLQLLKAIPGLVREGEAGGAVLAEARDLVQLAIDRGGQDSASRKLWR